MARAKRDGRRWHNSQQSCQNPEQQMKLSDYATLLEWHAHEAVAFKPARDTALAGYAWRWDESSRGQNGSLEHAMQHCPQTEPQYVGQMMGHYRQQKFNGLSVHHTGEFR